MTGTSPVYIPVRSLHRIELPVLAFWEPFKKVRLFGGVTVGNNLYAETGDRSLNNNAVYDIQNSAAKRNLNQEVSDRYRSWDTRWNLGAGFKPTRHLEVDFFLQQPFPSGHSSAMNKYSDSLDSQSSAGAPSLSSSGTGNGALFKLVASWFF